jgi:hypothetical protein
MWDLLISCLEPLSQKVTMGFNERRIMKNLYWFLLLLIAFPLLASAQNLEVSGGYAHISGDGGVDGFNVGAATWVSRRVSLAFDYDSAWDNSHLGAFELTQTGLIVTKSHLQDFLVGPRVSFSGMLKSKETYLPRLWPFAEVQLGASHLNSKLEDPTAGIYYWPFRHPLVFHHFPGDASYTVSCSADFSPGRVGLLQLLDVSLPSCCRYHPARVFLRLSQFASVPAAFTLRS